MSRPQRDSFYEVAQRIHSDFVLDHSGRSAFTSKKHQMFLQHSQKNWTLSFYMWKQKYRQAFRSSLVHLFGCQRSFKLFSDLKPRVNTYIDMTEVGMWYNEIGNKLHEILSNLDESFPNDPKTIQLK